MSHSDCNAEPLEFICLRELCGVCGVSEEWVLELMNEGVLAPVRQERAEPVFAAVAIRRVRVVRRLQRDLGVNHAGAALALELLDQLSLLRSRLRRLEDGDA